jgi:hypothetical protein
LEKFAEKNVTIMGGTACRAETLKGYDGEIVQDGAKYLHSPVHAGISKCDIYIYMIHMSYMINILVPVRF